ncbi:surface-adhesin E family protein [Acinetobacter bereziniae]|uniref:surface-adhesin E family protein n=1 Tax=Acinetobacter bereziniae TaxID=106648 RepID=UPI001900F229|nr:surface-adhesin E family protein [Acinetobacter bereziniae]MBJ8421915.1 hypothetical protein [Acinetobacter bereziniae]
MKKLICFGILGFISSFAFAEDWVLIGKSHQDKTYLNVKSLKISNIYGQSYLKAWVKFEIYNDVVKDGLSLGDYTLVLYQIDCNQQKIGEVSVVNYKNKMVYGKTKDVAFPNMTDIVPGTVGETILDTSCETYKYKN